ncbi:MAG: MlaD family protein [Ignavibacteriales bacterium]
MARRNLILIPAFVIITGAAFWFSNYTEDIEIFIVFDKISGIGPGSKLVLGGASVGEVKDAEVTDDGEVSVEAKIYKGYKDKVNSSSVFIIESPSGESDKKQITVEVLNEKAPPFSQGAKAEGYSSRAQFALRTQQKTLEDSYRKFENWLNQLRESEEGKKLKKQMQELMEEARKSAERGIEEFNKEMPRLKKKFDEIIEEFKKHRSGKEA